MAAPTQKQREAMPKSEFGLPSERKYPLDTPGRAINAKARAAQEEAKGDLTPAQEDQIRKRADDTLQHKYHRVENDGSMTERAAGCDDRMRDGVR